MRLFAVRDFARTDVALAKCLLWHAAMLAKRLAVGKRPLLLGEQAVSESAGAGEASASAEVRGKAEEKAA
eukprot:5230657-Alexandrium_andersonii.AAC.1